MTLTLHEHPFAAYCWKVLIALYDREVAFERVQINDDNDRARLAKLWPMASIPVLVDDSADLTLPESTLIVEYLDRFGDAPPLLPADAEAAQRARLWDRVMDAYIATPMQKIVADSLRPEGMHDPQGVAEARQALDRAYLMLDDHLRSNGDDEWLTGADFTLADCAAAPAVFYARVVHRWDEERLINLTRYWYILEHRPSVHRVIEEARGYRAVFPIPWPDHVS